MLYFWTLLRWISPLKGPVVWRVFPCRPGIRFRAYSRFAPSQWETALLCNDVSHWLGASLESVCCPVPWVVGPGQRSHEGRSQPRNRWDEVLCDDRASHTRKGHIPDLLRRLPWTCHRKEKVTFGSGAPHLVKCAALDLEKETRWSRGIPCSSHHRAISNKQFLILVEVFILINRVLSWLKTLQTV